jgi:TonB family protein
MPESSKPSQLRSAEFVVAVSLLAVCLAVGGTWWLLSSRDSAGAGAAAPDAASAASSPAAGSKSDERAALDSWKQKLQGDFAASDRERLLQAQRSDLDRRRQETDAAAARLEQLRAAAAAAARPKAAPPPAASPAPPVQTTGAARPAPAAAPAPAHEAVRTEASVDWSSCSRPQYPRSSIDRGEEGVVVLSFKLNAGGEVQNGTVNGSSGSARLDDAALRALQKCHFRPATVDGTAVAATATVRFQWQLGK